jgi:hypothetical protein
MRSVLLTWYAGGGAGTTSSSEYMVLESRGWVVSFQN